MLRTKDFEHVFFYEMCEDSFIEIKVNKAYFLTFVNNHTARITINIISHDDAPSLPVNNTTWSRDWRLWEHWWEPQPMYTN